MSGSSYTNPNIYNQKGKNPYNLLKFIHKQTLGTKSTNG